MAATSARARERSSARNQTSTRTPPRDRPPTRHEGLDPVTAYARDVKAGRIVAGRLVRLACERHLRDVKEQRTRGLVWRPDKGCDAIQFFEEVLYLPDVERDLDADELDIEDVSGVPFLLTPFQKFIVGSLFGWYTDAGTRRFRVAYVETGKGSGKTPLAAGIALYGLIVDGGRGAQVYTAAVKLEQAKLTFTDAENMVLASPELRALLDAGVIQQHVNNLSFRETGAFLRPISSEKRGLDGKRVYIAVVDELHEHPDDTVDEKVRAGTKGRKNALIFKITNSGFNRRSVCWRNHEYGRQILEGVLVNDAWFVFICHLDACAACAAKGYLQPNSKCETKTCDRWDVEGPHWIKANPNLGISITWEYLREQVAEAIGMPTKQNHVRRLNFCEWTDQRTIAIPHDAWAACRREIDWSTYHGRRAYLGLDLANTTDIASAVWMFDEEDGSVTVLPRFWVPKEGVRLRSEKDHVEYETWVEQGFITATEGNVIDYDAIRADLNADAELFGLIEAGYDPWNATQLATQLIGDGFTMVPVRQGYKTMSEPTKKLIGLVVSGKLNHDGNPVLAWMAANMVTRQDPVGNVAPDKAAAIEKIDGIVATIVGMSRLIVGPSDDGGTSIYETRGLSTV